MKDFHMQKVITRIEDAIDENQEKNLHDYVIAAMVIKGFTIRDCFEISQRRILMCDVNDMNISIALKNRLRLFDLRKFNDEENLAYVIEARDHGEPLTILNMEVSHVLMKARELVREIRYLLNHLEITEERKADSIESLFEEKVQKNVRNIIENSFEIYKFYFTVDLEITRKDGSTLIFNSEFAESEYEIKTGFARRPVLPDDSGMWYEFEEERETRFVTTDVCRDLSVAYVTKDGIISDIIDRKANDTNVYHNPALSKNILEVPQGWFTKNGIQQGDRIKMKTIFASY